MKRAVLLVVLLVSGCVVQVKHEWKNGFTCKCRGNIVKSEATCDCGPTPKCPKK